MESPCPLTSRERTINNQPTPQYDSIIIGAGHNGLVCAAYLARAGQKVLLLESGPEAGGLARSREFHAGFRAPVAHSVNHFPEKIFKDLGLDRHGLELQSEAMPLTGLSTDGKHVRIEGATLTGAGDQDLQAWPEYLRLMQKFAAALEPFWLKTMPRIAFTGFRDLLTFGQVGLNMKRLGKEDMREFLRIVSLPTRDLMDEFFENPVLKALLSWDGLIGSRMAPRSPNNAVLAMLYRMRGHRNDAAKQLSGGVTQLIASLLAAAQDAGVDIRTDTRVTRILVNGSESGLSANGVQLSDGTVFHSERVISSINPQNTFVDLLGVENLEIGFTNRIRRLRCDGLVAKLHLALSELPEFTGLAAASGRLIIAPDLDAIEFAFDDSKYGECSEHPVLEIAVPSLEDNSLAPAGQHVLSVHIMYVPYRMKNDWDDAAREALCDRVVSLIENYAPGLSSLVLQRELLTPADLEQEFGVKGGHWHQTEFALDQVLMMRPTYEAAQYHTPVPGLFLCGAGCHPGGDLTGAPGHNAAQEILR